MAFSKRIIVASLSLVFSVASATNYEFDCGDNGSGSITIDSKGMDFDVNLVGLVKDGIVSSPGVPLSYHLHTIWNNKDIASSTSQCGSDFTGLHYDPTFKCGPASQARDEAECKAKKAYTCSTSAPEECELGDLSGKYGTLVVDKDGSASKSVKNDKFGATNDQFLLDATATSSKLWSSIVFHDTTNKGARVLCCKIKEQLLVAKSAEYIYESNPFYKQGDPNWTDTRLRMCIMEEIPQGTPLTMPKTFTYDQKKDGSGNYLSLTGKGIRLRKLDTTESNIPCWERRDIKHKRRTCDGWHIDESKNGHYRVHLCN